MVGSASEAGQLLKSPRASTTTASLSSRIDENQLSALACQQPSLIISVTARDDGCREASFLRPPYGDETCEMMDRHDSRSAADQWAARCRQCAGTQR